MRDLITPVLVLFVGKYKENEGRFDFLALVVKFGFWGEVTTAFCKMRWLVGGVQ